MLIMFMFNNNCNVLGDIFTKENILVLLFYKNLLIKIFDVIYFKLLKYRTSKCIDKTLKYI